jgi:threonyl-tRNA synthetase
MSLKPMNCPSHHLLIGPTRDRTASLPLALRDVRPPASNELSGALSGLTRVRQFAQDDCHVYLREDQIASEVKFLMDFILGHYEASASSRASSSRRVPKRASATMRCGIAPRRRSRSASRRRACLHVNDGDGAFYGRRSTSTSRTRSAAVAARHDPAGLRAPERFDLTYVGEDNAEHRPVVIHRAVSASLERFIAILIEHFAGAFPLWLAPLQVIVLPIADRHADYASEVVQVLDAAGLRAEVDDRQEKVNYKIREAQLTEDSLHAGGRGQGVADRAVAVRRPEKGGFGPPAAESVPDRRACRGPV